MNIFKTRGLVLREYETGEPDKRIIMLCKNYGKVMLYMRGARKAKSKFLTASQLFTYSDLIIADGRTSGKQFYTLTQADIIESFYQIRHDYDKLIHAQYMLEICDKAIPERTNCDDLLLLLLKTLQILNSGKTAPKLAVRIFLFRFFLINGISPEMDKCSVCGGGLNSAGVFFHEGMVCIKCRVQNSIPLSAPAQYALRHIIKSDLKNAFLFHVPDNVVDELAMAAKLCRDYHFSIYLNTEKLI